MEGHLFDVEGAEQLDGADDCEQGAEVETQPDERLRVHQEHGVVGQVELGPSDPRQAGPAKRQIRLRPDKRAVSIQSRSLALATASRSDLVATARCHEI